MPSTSPIASVSSKGMEGNNETKPFAESSNSKKINNMAVGRQLSEDEIADLKEAFSMFDKDGDGTITIDELRIVFRKLGQKNITDRALIEMIMSVDDNGDGEIDFNEFLVLMRSHMTSDPDKELRDAFRVFDTDGSGTISKKELKTLMRNLGQKLSDEEIDAMMSEVDTDGNGEIDFTEFKQMMNS